MRGKETIRQRTQAGKEDSGKARQSQASQVSQVHGADDADLRQASWGYDFPGTRNGDMCRDQGCKGGVYCFFVFSFFDVFDTPISLSRQMSLFFPFFFFKKEDKSNLPYDVWMTEE